MYLTLARAANAPKGKRRRCHRHDSHHNHHKTKGCRRGGAGGVKVPCLLSALCCCCCCCWRHSSRRDSPDDGLRSLLMYLPLWAHNFMPRPLGRCLIAPTACSRCLSLSKIPLCPACSLLARIISISVKAAGQLSRPTSACYRAASASCPHLPPFPPLFHSYLILIQHQQRKLSVFFISSPSAAGKAKQRTAARAYPALAAHPLLAAYTHTHIIGVWRRGIPLWQLQTCV